jgi:hypothetical protein
VHAVGNCDPAQGDGVATVVQQAEGSAPTPPVATRIACAAFVD